MIKAAAAAGYLDERAAVLEALTVDPPRGRGHRDHLPRQGGGRVASVGPKVREPQGRLRRAARRARQEAAEPDAGQLPARAAPVRARGRPGGGVRGRGHAPRPAPARRADHPPGHADLRHARARLQLDAGGGEGGRREPPPRGQDRQLAPGRLAQLPAQPRLQHVVHDRHRARLEARAARARSTCSPSSPAPSRCASCPRSSCSRSAWTSRWRRAPRHLAGGRRRRGPDGARRRSSCRTSTTP